MTKKCNKCKKTKDVSEFYKRHDRTIGYRYLCKVCDHKDSMARRKKSGWKNEKKRQGPGTKHSKQSKINSQKHRDELSDMYERGLIVKKTENLNPKDIPNNLVKAYRINLMLKRELGLTNKKENK